MVPPLWLVFASAWSNKSLPLRVHKDSTEGLGWMLCTQRLCIIAEEPQAWTLLLGLGPGPAWAQGACGSHSSSPTRPPAPWRGWIYEGGSACASLGRIVQGPCGHRVSHSLSCCWWGGGGTALALGWFPIFSCDLLVETRCLSPRPGHPGAHCQSASQMISFRTD